MRVVVPPVILFATMHPIFTSKLSSGTPSKRLTVQPESIPGSGDRWMSDGTISVKLFGPQNVAYNVVR